ncbi:synaptotagmin-like protein 2 [Hoplias malabaricus]|uniref:synaptotagmin-like protein 2 n=1 Tax=Hoplias malabaricus TaxID=27720 RepID=UPI0034626939
MIDLSYLTEEEQEMIMTVLKRDVELKKSEENRIKHLQNLDPEECRLKYMTGEWFYEAKSQRHQDRIHGSEIIMASMKQKKPMTMEFLTQSWRERSSKYNNDPTTLKPGTSNNQKSGTSEAQKDRLNSGIRSPSRPRHNPFNTVQLDLDRGETNSQPPNAAPGPGTKKALLTGMMPPVQNCITTETCTKSQVPDTLQELAPLQKPVPRKRTRLYQLQSSVTDSTSSVSTQSVSTSSGLKSPTSTQSVSTSSTISSPISTPSVSTCSESKSTVSTQSQSTNSGMMSPLPRGILKHSSIYNSSNSNIKNHFPQPLNRSSLTPTRTSPEQEYAITKGGTESPLISQHEQSVSASQPKPTLPKSRLPIIKSYLMKKRRNLGLFLE